MSPDDHEYDSFILVYNKLELECWTLLKSYCGPISKSHMSATMFMGSLQKDVHYHNSNLMGIYCSHDTRDAFRKDMASTSDFTIPVLFFSQDFGPSRST